MSRRDSAMTEVKAGCCKNSMRTSWPMAPVAPVMSTFMLEWRRRTCAYGKGSLFSLGYAIRCFVGEGEVCLYRMVGRVVVV